MFAVQPGKALAPWGNHFRRRHTQNRNAKVMPRIVRAAYLGEKLADTSAIENPAALDQIQRATK